MKLTITDDLDLWKIAESGQCFRWEMVDLKTWRIIAGDNSLYVSYLGNMAYEFDCDVDEFNNFWAHYFDLDENYQRIRKRISPMDDPFLWLSMEQETGIRILRQDPWEMLITSIITQNRNIPAIKKSIELLSAMCGSKQCDSKGVTYYAFPLPEQLITLTKEQLIGCRLGYRWKYVHSAALAVHEGIIDLNKLQDNSCEDIIHHLTSLYGVGEKVACCVALFGFHQLNAFPRDVWINRILNNKYPNGYPFDRYSPYNGVYQQYMFAYYRKTYKGEGKT